MNRTVSVITQDQKVAHQVEVPSLLNEEEIISLLQAMFGFRVIKIEAGLHNPLRGYDYLITEKSIETIPSKMANVNLEMIVNMKGELDTYRKALQDIVKIEGNSYNKEDAVIIANTAKSIAWNALRKHGDNK